MWTARGSGEGGGVASLARATGNTGLRPHLIYFLLETLSNGVCFKTLADR
ncbi:hypothetical protein CCP2SC5_910011 [Azospirillaceae bacterium]